MPGSVASHQAKVDTKPAPNDAGLCTHLKDPDLSLISNISTAENAAIGGTLKDMESPNLMGLSDPLQFTEANPEPTQKPLPPTPPHFERTKSEAPGLGISPKPSEPSHHNARPSSSGSASFQRPKIRVIWRNKGCMIALPIDSDFGKKTSRDSYLSPHDVATRLKRWEDQGYDTRGFLLAPSKPGVFSYFGEGQSKAIHPDPEEESERRNKRDFRVNIPDRREWEKHVEYLKEEKLRALGVSSGEEEPLRTSPAPFSMSRQTSSPSSTFLNSPASGPVSNHAMHYPPDYQSSHTLFGHRGKSEVSHFSRYSTLVLPAEKPLSPSTQYFSSPPFPVQGGGSNQHYVDPQPGSRVSSPLVNGLGPTMNTTSITMPPNVQGQASSQDSWRRQQALLQTQHSQQLRPVAQGAVSNSRPPPGQAMNASGSSFDDSPNIVAPTPQGHRQNPSETLQREIDDAESYEASSKMQEAKQSHPPLKAQMGPADLDPNSLQAPRKQSPEREIAGSDVEEPTGFAENNNTLKSLGKSSHLEHQAQTSKLNATAPEFKFGGKGAYISARSEAPLNNQSRHLEDSVPTSKLSRDTVITVPPSDNSQITKLNVAAPEFTPGAVSRIPSIPVRAFSFSASMPSLKPDAPSFEPKNPDKATIDDGTNEVNPVEIVKKIFGEVRFPEVVKPAKESKAIPIVKPEDGSHGLEDSAAERDDQEDGQEDESGRITQANGRQKRMRRAVDDGDQVPLFASPNQTPWMNNDRDEKAAYFSSSPSGSEQGEPSTLEAATDLLEEIIDEMSATEASELLREDDSVNGDGRVFEPHTFHDIDDAASFNAARPRESSREPDAELLNVSADDVLNATAGFLEKSPQFKANFNEALRRHRSRSRSPGLIEAPSGNLLSPPNHPDGIECIDHARKDIIQGVRYVEPSYNELDAIMRHLNQDSDHGIERRSSPFKRRGQSMSPVRSNAPEHYHTSRSPMRESFHELHTALHTSQALPSAIKKSHTPSPSPHRMNGTIEHPAHTDTESIDTSAQEKIERIARGIAKNPLDSPSWPSKKPIPLHHLNSPGSSPPSDWNEALTPADEDKFQSRAGFFDSRVNDVVGGIVQQRLDPVEQTLSSIQHSLALLSSGSANRRPRSSNTLEAANSDADDEDDTGELSQSRLRSPLKDRKYEQLKAIVSEITTAQQSFASASQLDEVLSTIKDLKSSVQQPVPISNGDASVNADEAGRKQSRGRSAPITSSSVAAVAEKSQLQIAGLESMLKIAESRANDELKARRLAEDALIDSQRSLKSALHDAAEQRESAEATEHSLQDFSGERQENLKRIVMLEASNGSLEDTVLQYAKKCTALEDTLAEYRLSHDQWREEIDEARYENNKLQRHLKSMKDEVDDANEGRRILRTKFERLQESMAHASQDAAAEQLRQHVKEGENAVKLDALGSRLEAEARTRERLELEIERLEAQEKEVMHSRITNEQIKEANAQMQDVVNELRSECHEQHKIAARFEREALDAKANAQAELTRARNVMETEIQVIDNQLKKASLDHESDILRYQKQLEDQVTDSSIMQHKLGEMSASRDTALKEAAEQREAALQEHLRSHERTIGEMSAQHKRSLTNALEDKERSETYFGHRLNLADEKIEHYQDRMSLLEEKLDIAKSAAHAAVQAAQAKRPSGTLSNSTALSVNKTSSIPEKISPQALRESILVLQEQLQERETRIEQLESELASIDTNAPARLKDAEVEITWLRELLGVRYDDLQDIIVTLSQPDYDAEAVKDAAVRLRANMQMEQQEKERALPGSQSFPSLSSITNLAASPRALPLAAAAAWGNWRKNRDVGSGNANTLVHGNVQQTPSKPSPQSFFAGLMTPPSTNMRTTPPIAANARPLSSSTRQTAGLPTTPKQQKIPQSHSQRQQEPVTPPLMRKTSYDLDASESVSGLGDEGVEGNRMAGEEEEPFGPRLGGIVEPM